MHRFSLPATPEAKAKYSYAKTDHYLIGQLPDFIEAAKRHKNYSIIRTRSSDRRTYFGNLSWEQSMAKIEEGCMETATKAEAMLSKVETFLPPPTASHMILDDVVGAFPNVPAYLAGQPLSMRRKVRRDSEAAPIAIVLSLGSSAMISADDLFKRGIAVLALVRAISSRRPIELWAGASMCGGNKTESGNVYFQIPTTPLDLARAAHLIAHPSMARYFVYDIAEGAFGTSPSIPWYYMSGEQKGETMRPIMTQAFPHMSEILIIPTIYGTHPSITDPVAWIKDTVRTCLNGAAIEGE